MAEEKKERTMGDLTPVEGVDFFVRQTCILVPQGANPQDWVRECEAVGEKIKEALEK